MNQEARLREALRSRAQNATPDAADWVSVTKRAGALRTRRRIATSAVALVGVVVLAVGVLAAAGAFKGSASRSIVAAPSPISGEATGDIVAALDHSVVVLSSEDGHVVRTLVDGLNEVGGVAVSPDGETVYYTRSPRACSSNLPQGTGGLTKIGINGGGPQDFIGGAADPLISPDGRWLAYSYATCDAPDAVHIGVLDLTTQQRYWPLDGAGPQHAVPLAWSADSQSLLYLGSEGDVFRLDGIPQPGSPTNLTPGLDPVTSATLTHDNSVLIARQEANTFIVQHFDPTPAGMNIRFIADGQSPTAMSFDAGDRLLLRAADGTLSVQEGTVTGSEDSRSIPQGLLPHTLLTGVHGAAWIPHVATPPASTTTTPEATTTTADAAATTTTTTPPTVSTLPPTDEAAISAVFAAWMGGPHTDDHERATVEDGNSILSAVHAGLAQHTPDDLAKYSGRADSIQMIDADHATVQYTLLWNGQPQFGQRTGTAIRVNGTWKVSRDTECQLLTLGGITCPPRT